ncbi:MAG: ABC transporter ATP-binding protein [Pseudomonadota bacterium]|nr:ABC transporter ATP-binding protein [Pseudomonadota bacterium]
MTQTPIEIFGLCKSHAGRPVLDRFSLTVGRGESVALLGLNGAGKTTLLRCLLDFQRAESGTIRIDGFDARTAAARRQVSFLPERFQAPAFLTGLEFLQLSARLHGVPWDAAGAEVACGRLALDWPLLRQPLGRLSKGSSQKLGLAACLLSNRRIYILDEPLSGLDVQARVLALDQLQRLREEGCTLLFTCHEPADVDVLSHRVALLHRGTLHYCDTPARLRADHPGPSLGASVLACLAAPAHVSDPPLEPQP